MSKVTLENDKYWGSLQLDEIGKAIKQVPNKFKNHEKYGKQLTIDAKIWDDGNITLSVYKADTKERFVVGTLRPSKAFEADGHTKALKNQASTEAQFGDLPF